MDSSSSLSDDDIHFKEKRSAKTGKKARDINSAGCKPKKQNENNLVGKVDKSPDVFVICETSSSSEDSDTSWPCSNASMSSQQKKTESRSQPIDKNCLSLKKTHKGNEEQVDSQVDQFKGLKLAKSLFSSTKLNKTFTDDGKRIRNTVASMSHSENNDSGNLSARRKRSRLSLRKLPEFTHTVKPESHNEISNLVEKLSRESDECSSKSATREKGNKNESVSVEKTFNLRKSAVKNFTNCTVSSKTTQKVGLMVSETSVITVSESDTSTDDNCAVFSQSSIFAKKYAVPENQHHKVFRREQTKQTSHEDNSFREESVLLDSDSNNSDIKVKVSQSVEENVEAKAVLDICGENSHLKQKAKKLSDTTGIQANDAGSFLSQEVIGSLKNQAPNICNLSLNLMTSLKNKKLTLAKLINAKVSSLQKKHKEPSEETIIISSDEETIEMNDERKAQTHKVKESNSGNKISVVNRNPPASSSMTRSSSLEANSAAKENSEYKSHKVSDNLNSKNSSPFIAQKLVPSLSGSSDDSSLSQQIPYQGECINHTASKTRENQDPTALRLVANSSNASTSLMPSLQRKPSSFYDNDLFEERSPPFLSKYFVTSTPVPPEESIPVQTSSPVNSDVNMKGSSLLVSIDRKCSSSANEHVASNEADMFSESSNSCIEHSDDVHDKVRDILDMLGTADEDDEFKPEQHSPVKTVQEQNYTKCSTDNKPGYSLQHSEPGPSGTQHLNVSAASPVTGDSEPLDHTVIKEEDIDAFSDKANASMYSEINDEIYVLDSDDDEFFMSQSFQFTQNASTEKKEQGLSVKEFDDRTAFKQQNSSEETALKDPESSRITDVLTVFETDSDESDIELLHDETLLIPLLPEKLACHNVQSSENSDNEYNNFHNTSNGGKNNICKKNEPSGVDRFTDDHKAEFDDDDESYFLSQTDDVDDWYIAQTQVDYVTIADEYEQTEDGAECKDNVTDIVKNSGGEGGTSVTLDSIKKAKEPVREQPPTVLKENITKSQFSPSAIGDTQDPFCVATQVCFPSVTEEKGQYEAETLFSSYSLDEGTQAPTENDTHSNPDLIPEKEDPYDIETLTFSSFSNVDLGIKTNHQPESKDEDPYDRETLTLSPTSSEDSESFFTMATQNRCHQEAEKEDLYERRMQAASSLPKEDMQDSVDIDTQDSYMNQNVYGGETQAVSPRGDLDSLYSLSTQKSFQSKTDDQDPYDRETQAVSSNADLNSLYSLSTQKSFKSKTNDQDPYDRETQAVSPSSSEGSECFLSMATQRSFQSEPNDHDLYDRETVVVPINEDIQYPVDSETFKISSRASREENNLERVTHTISPNKNFDNLYNVATQKDFQSQPKELNLYDRETLAVSQSLSEDSECSFTTATEKSFNSEKNMRERKYLYERETVPESLNEDTQHPFDNETQENYQLVSKEQDPYEMMTQAFSTNEVLDSEFNMATQKDCQSKDQSVYDRETYAASPSSSQDSECFFTMATQKVTQKDSGSETKGQDTYGRETLAGSAAFMEDTQNSLDTEVHKNLQSVSREQSKIDKVTSAFSAHKEFENVYNVATQKSCLSEMNEQNRYNRETLSLAASHSANEDLESLFTKEMQNSSETKYHSQEDTVSPSLAEETQDPFNMEIEDQVPRCGEPTASISFSRGMENYVVQTQKDISPSKQQNLCKKKGVVVSDSSRGDDSSDGFFNMATQKDACHLNTDQNPYDVPTMSVCPSLNEQTQDPFSVETQIDSLLSSIDECLYNQQTQVNSPSLNKNNEDPYCVETEVDSLPLEEHSSICQAALAVSVSKDTKNRHLIHTQRDIIPVPDVILNDNQTGAVSLRKDNEGQTTSYSETEIQHSCLFPTNNSYSKCAEDQIHESLAKSFFPVKINQTQSCVKVQKEVQPIQEEQDPFITETPLDFSSKSEGKHSNVERQNCLIQEGHENYQSRQSALSSESPILKAHKLINIKSSEASEARQLIMKLSMQSSHKVPTVSKEPRKGINFIQQNLQSPYFVKSKRESLSAKSDVGIYVTETLASTLSSGDMRQNGLSSVERLHDFSDSNGKKSFSKSDDKNIPSADKKINSLKHSRGETVIPKKNPAALVSSSISSKRPALQNNEECAKRKCTMKYDPNERQGITADRKRQRENKEFETSITSLKKAKMTSSDSTLESSCITAGKYATKDSRHKQSSSLKKNSSKSRRPRSKPAETNKAVLTSQVEIAKQKLRERNIEIISARPILDQTESSSSNVCDVNDDVEMPSTQDMMNLGLPILNAKLPVSKRLLAQGLPSQGRIASEERDQAEKFQVSRGKNVSQNSVLPPVPLFNSTPTDKRSTSRVAEATSHDADTTFSTHTAVMLESFSSPRPPFSKSIGSNLGQSFVVSTCHQISRTEPTKLITETQRADRLSSLSSSSPTSAAEFAHTTLSTMAQLIPVNYSVPILSTSALNPGSICLPEPNSATHSNHSKKAQETPPNYKGILKSNSSVSHQNRTLPKVKFSDPSYDSHLPARPQITLPQTDVLQLQESAKSKPEAKLYFLSTILNWNPIWLQERENHQGLPELFGSKKTVEEACCLLRMYYSTFHEYVDLTLNLLVLECWETIYRDWKVNKSRFPLEVHCLSNKMYETKIPEGLSLNSVDVVGLIKPEDRWKVPSVGDFLIINFWGARKGKNGYDEPRLIPQFAFVKSVSYEYNFNKDNFLQTYRIFESSAMLRESNPVCVKVKLVLRNKGFIIIPTKLHTIKAVSTLKIIERQIDALIYLPESMLCTHLLKPDHGVVFSHQKREPDAQLLSKLNREQASAVATILPDVTGNPLKQKVFLLQGPPGTGKSHTILALIHQILVRTKFAARICLATPSNAAVDEIAKRIISFSNQLKEKRLKTISLVRVGNRNKVQSDVQRYMWDELVTQKLNEGVPESLKAEMNSLKKQGLELGKSLSDPSLAQEQKVVKIKKQMEIKRQISKLEADIRQKCSSVREKYSARCRVLDEAHVICGTLHSFGSNDLKEIVLRSEQHRHKSVPFTCLIIDEATQAIEVDCLIPLQYKMTKVVLVGDHEQLPATVLSQVAFDKCLARSLFERMDFCIKEFSERNISPVMLLTRQYRMHEEILYLPNSFFYDRQLVTDGSVLARKEVIAPYLVFDIQESRESRGESRSVSNEDEAVCTAQLCEIVNKKMTQIGVICPYADQQQVILEHLRQRNLHIEVNTVDSFQGQERDVIIMSCVRAQRNPLGIGFVADRKRMNVALTRAKRAMYVIGHFATLCRDALWAELYRNAEERKLLVKVMKVTDFKMSAEIAVMKT